VPKIDIELQPKQTLFDRALERYPIVFYGGAKGGGKSMGLRLVWLKRFLTIPGSRNVIFRRTYQELEDNHIGPLLTQYPSLRPYYNPSKHAIRIPGTDSEYLFRYCKKETDVLLHQGIEYHSLGIEEVGQWSEWMFWRLMGSNRSGRADIPARAGLTGNPGGLGHAFLKRLFVQKRLKAHELEAGYVPEDFHFVPARVYDNEALMENDPGYLKRLKAEPNEQLRKAYLDGSWDIAAGQFFGSFDREVHLVKPFDVPSHWEWFGGYDYGFAHPCVWGWWVADERGNIYRVRTIYKAGLHLDEQAAEVHRIESELVAKKWKRSKQTTFWAGRDCWATRHAIQSKGHSDITIAEEFMKPSTVGANIVYLKPANVARKLGAAQLRQRMRFEMRPGPKGVPERWGPQIFFFDTPENEPIVECVTRMVSNPDDIEDVLKVDATEGDPFTGDDGYDEVRHAIMSRPISSTEPRKSRGTSYNDDDVPRRSSWQTV
jgi:hypothetical protein